MKCSWQRPQVCSSRFPDSPATTFSATAFRRVSSYTEEVINNLFRGMPYAYLAGNEHR